VEGVHLKRRLTAVLLADVVGYSRLMSVDEAGTHALLADCFDSLIKPKVSEHGGRMIRTSGDGLLVEFDSAFDAVRCGIDIQHELTVRGAGVDAEHRLQMRIGINAGDVIVDDRDIYGNSVNIAARLEGLAEPGELYVTGTVRDQLLGAPDLAFEDRGDRWVKNISRPVRVFRVEHAHEHQRPFFLRRMVLGAERFPRFFLRARPMILVPLVLAIVAILGSIALPILRKQSVRTAQASIMVLPFRNLSDNPEEGYFADAVTDELTTDLSRMSDTLVIARGTAFTYKGKDVDPRQIGQDVDVQYLLEGSIRRVGTKVQANAQLVDARSAVHVWSDRFDTDVTDLLELQEAVTGRIAASLGVQLIKAASRRGERETSPNSIDLRLHAMALTIDSMTAPHTLAARRYLEESVSIDPSSASAWSELAFVLITDYLNRWNEAEKDASARKELLRRAEDALQKALNLDPSLALAQLVDGFIRRARGDHHGSLDAFDRALERDPNLALAYAQKANELVLIGRSEEAPPLVMKAIRLSPRDPSIGVFYWVLGRAYFLMQNYDDTIVWLRKSIAERPTLWFNRAYLISAYALAGRNADARAELGELNKALPGYTLARIQEIYALEIPNAEPSFQASLQQLYKGLQQAGMM
jgi:adenylate cyclase